MPKIKYTQSDCKYLPCSNNKRHNMLFELFNHIIYDDLTKKRKNTDEYQIK